MHFCFLKNTRYCPMQPQLDALKEWMEFRSSYGEQVTGTSWVIRDIWQATNINYGAKLGLATAPKKLKSSGLKRLLESTMGARDSSNLS